MHLGDLYAQTELPLVRVLAKMEHVGIAVDAVAVDGTVTVDGMKLVDDVIMTPKTGRRSYDELEKTEKTYIGTRVEIEITVEHHRRYAPGTVVALPFYEPEWKRK